MAFASVAATALTSGTTAGTSHAINLPTGIVSGSRVTVAMGINNAPTVTLPGGWTSVADIASPGSLARGVFIYRDCDGSEGSTITITLSASSRITAVAERWTGHDASTAPAAATAAGAAGTTYDPPNVAPSWGAEDTVFGVVAAIDGTGVTTHSSYPANYTDGQQFVNDAATSSACTAYARRQLNAASDDPGTGSISNSREKGIITFAIRPSGAGGAAALAGTIAAAGTFAGNLSTEKPLAGTIAASATLAGDLTVVQPAALAGTIAAVATLSGDLSVVVGASLAGNIVCASVFAGNLTVPTTAQLAGHIAALSVLQGQLARPPDRPVISAIGTAIIEVLGPPSTFSKWGTATWGHATSDWVDFSWQDVTPQSLNATIRWGVVDNPVGVLSVPQADTFDVHTYDPFRRLDPSNPMSVLATVLKPGTRVRIRYAGTLSRTVRYGVIDEIRYSLDTKQGFLRAVGKQAQLQESKPVILHPQGGLKTRVETVLGESGVTGIEVVADWAPIDNPDIGGSLEEGVSAWQWIDTSALDALVAVWFDNNEKLRMRKWDSPVNNGLKVGGNVGIPVEDVETSAVVDGLFSKVVTFDENDLAQEIYAQDDEALALRGHAIYRRDRPIPQAQLWANAVMADRGTGVRQYRLGILRPVEEDQLIKLIEAGMNEEVEITVNAVDPILQVTGIILGGSFGIDPIGGWSAGLITYIPQQ
jgi:hypothetical protein